MNDFTPVLLFLLGYYNYLAAIFLIMLGLYIVVRRPNLIKKIIGLSLFQNGIFLFFISVGMAEQGQPPILIEGVTNYANPLPHVLILTAIVVGVATMAVGLALVVRIGEAYGTIEATEIAKLEEL